MDTLKKHSTAKKQIKADKPQLSSNSQLRESKIIPESPFTAHRYDDLWIITCGNYKAMNILQSYDECIELVQNPDWDILAMAMQAMIEAHDILKEKTNPKI